jgi:chromosome segregation ATPase
MTELDDLSMKILQLECIIDAKDREISILRTQELGTNAVEQEVNALLTTRVDPALCEPELTEEFCFLQNLLQELQQENQSLKSQLAAVSAAQSNNGSCSKQQAACQIAHLPAAAEYDPIADEVLLQLNVSGQPVFLQSTVLQQVCHVCSITSSKVRKSCHAQLKNLRRLP